MDSIIVVFQLPAYINNLLSLLFFLGKIRHEFLVKWFLNPILTGILTWILRERISG